ncbi:universal stress protein [Thalassomonas sp. RHCl1]|uniref:universal stress protein n=1 Tax=Thalassomonas sp. RHCl1 TaxID=2995320 RepID=UPI00248CAF86|nr:universal stress protein [Thalassomonas sp. RHCl1]
MSKILVIAHREDESPTAINKALQLAERYCADIHIMAFCHEELESVGSFTAEQVEQVKQQIIDKRHQWVQNQIAQLEHGTSNITVETQWKREIYKAVLQEVSTNDYRFIVAQHHGTGSFFHISTEWYLLRESRIPVYLVRQDEWKSQSTVMAAVDLKNDSVEGKLMREQVMSAAADFAKTFDSALHCCFCFELPEVLIDLDVIDKARYQDEVREKYLPQMQALAKEYHIDEENLHVKFGNPQKCIASVATKSKTHTVVIGSMARTGIKGKLIGNTAEKLTAYLHTDMLIVAPV